MLHVIEKKRKKKKTVVLLQHHRKKKLYTSCEAAQKGARAKRTYSTSTSWRAPLKRLSNLLPFEMLTIQLLGKTY